MAKTNVAIMIFSWNGMIQADFLSEKADNNKKTLSIRMLSLKTNHKMNQANFQITVVW